MWQAALALFALAEVATATLAPRPAPPLYVTHNEGLAIRIPRGLTYCPLPDDWVGTDHGVALYLTPPSGCGGAGFQSSDRDAKTETPAIGIYYEINSADFADRRPCRLPVAMRVFGRNLRACRRRDHGWITVEAWTDYSVDTDPHDLILTLRTTKTRYASDLARFRAFAEGVRACRPEWAAGRQPACPKTQWF
jgi:hypothetical protein